MGGFISKKITMNKVKAHIRVIDTLIYINPSFFVSQTQYEKSRLLDRHFYLLYISVNPGK